MAYSDFTLKKVKSDFGIKTVENISVFSEMEEIDLSESLTKTLQRNVPLALAINTEKARSELIIINILLELKEKFSDKISLFSGIEFSGIDFNVDKDKGLNGFCDYIISGSSEQLYLDVPVIVIVEAKNENINSGMGQCIAEMYAAKIFNEAENQSLSCIYGAITTGDEWRFIKLKENIAYIDLQSYYMSDIKKVVGILKNMAEQKA
jgi:hypothetical protein